LAVTETEGAAALERLERGWWTAHARGEFPTKVRVAGLSGAGRWVEVPNEGSFLTRVATAARAGAAAHSLLNPLAAGPRPAISKVLYEVDAEDLEHSYPIAREVARLLVTDHGAVPRVYFSGRRSLHVYADFQPVPLPASDPRDAYSRVYAGALDVIRADLGPEAGRALDSSFATPEHMSRVPFTRHEETGLLSIPVAVFDLPREADRAAVLIRRAAADPEWGAAERVIPEPPDPGRAPSERLRSEVEALVARYRAPRAPRVATHTGAPSGSGGRIAWVEALLGATVTEGRHRLTWLVVAPYLANVVGFPEDQAVARAIQWVMACNAAKPTQLASAEGQRQVRYWVRRAKHINLKPLSLRRLLTDPRFADIRPELEPILAPFLRSAADHEEGGDGATDSTRSSPEGRPVEPRGVNQPGNHPEGQPGNRAAPQRHDRIPENEI
jgi:hypothetical protein